MKMTFGVNRRELNVDSFVKYTERKKGIYLIASWREGTIECEGRIKGRERM